jgi:plastocyanin
VPSHRPTTRTRGPLLIALAALVVLAIAACGSSNSSTTSSTATTTEHPTGSSTAAKTPASAGTVQKLTLEADKTGELKYNKTALTAKAGSATLTLTNNSPIAHNVTVENSSGGRVAATTTFTGGSHTIPLKLKPGTYKFFCSVPGHRMAGMEGTLTVE